MPDHHRLGRELGLFDTDPLFGAGLPYWLPDGATVRHVLEEYVRTTERRAGYQHVYSPVLGKRELFEISGHWSHYSDDMFPPMNLGAEQVVLRLRDGRRLPASPAADVVARIGALVDAHRTERWDASLMAGGPPDSRC